MAKRTHYWIDYRWGLSFALVGLPAMVLCWYLFRPVAWWPTWAGAAVGLLVGLLRNAAVQVSPARFLECSDELGLRQAFFASRSGTWAMYITYTLWLIFPGILFVGRWENSVAMGVLAFQYTGELFSLPGKKLLSETVPVQETP